MRHYSDDGKWIEKLAEQARILGEARMLRDDEPITDEKTKLIFTRFSEYIARTKGSNDKAARSMGISASTLSQVLSGSYAADAEPIIRKIDKWIEQRLIKEASGNRDTGLVKTTVVDQMYGLTKFIAEINMIGLVTGPAGIGKTRTLRAIRSDFPGSIYISITRAGQSTLSVLDAIAAELRLTGLKLTSYQLHQQIVNILKDTERLIIVDEVHRLAGRRNDEALHALKDLHDHTGSTDDKKCPMLWAGMRNIADYIEQGKARFEPLEQIDSRIGYRLDLTAAAESIINGGPGLFTLQDIERYVAAQKVRLTSDGMRYLQMIANEPKLGALRTVDALLKVCQKVAANRVIDAQMLRSIFSQQRGTRFVEHFEQSMEIRVAAAG